MANHLRCNSSFVHQLFQAQFRSSLTCPHCLKQSSTFDPFLCVSLPIPRKRTQNLYVNVVYLCQQPRQVFLPPFCFSFFTNSSRFYGILPGDHKILVRIVYSSHSKVLSILQPVDTREMRIVDNSSIWNLIHSSPLWHL